MNYQASLDTFCKVLTIGVCILFIAIGQLNVRAIINSDKSLIPILIHGSTLLVFIVIIIVSYLYSTHRYTLTSNQLIIKRPIGNKIISLADLKEARFEDFSGTIRTFGNGGFLGYYGKYYSKKLGNTTWYVTQRKNRILLLTKQGHKIVVSPDDASLLDKIQATIKSKQG